ncbi:hypothetical protein L210DRAFT_2249423 [Boletus edulis BED1]|uniref:G domain-containing protein n=1 Tax=Boletus edulis BED1 TaxID=1328754 RepID=A0AAD4BDD7_BOLED|nr:hypothetical protein L210DRAFT_2249423 [Boletus edulis BED1]
MGKLWSWIRGHRDLAFQLDDNDIVVFVVGPSGSGKSKFVEQATESSDLIKVGTGLQPCTTTVRAIRCELTEGARAALGTEVPKNIVFVDTPSFHTQARAGRNSEAAEKEMKGWLKSSKSKSNPSLVGTIYMHRVETDPRYESVQQHLDAFTHTFPKDCVPFPQRLHAVFSHYDGVLPPQTIELRRETFEEQLRALHPSLGKPKWDTSFHPIPFRVGDSEAAWQAVMKLFSRTQS